MSPASVPGTVTKITNFGVFVELEQGLEGLLHILLLLHRGRVMVHVWRRALPLMIPCR